MKEPNWLLRDSVVVVQQALIAEHGGVPGIRDEGMLESALGRPVNQFHYRPEATRFELAAAYAYGLARNRPFLDGNKRIAFVAVAMFLGDNGHAFVPDKMEALATFLALAAGEVAEDALAAWIVKAARPR